jgi:tRNA dimethylallyltransferase
VKNRQNKILVPVIAGPTAIGKTALSLQLARFVQGEIISADSMQIYRHMNIGTAKPEEEEKQGIPHHLMDQINPDERFTVADFQEQAVAAIESISSRGFVPIVTGGTGLYIHSLLYRMDFTEIEIDTVLRERLEEEADRFGAEVMHQRLVLLDAAAAARIHPNNVRRVIRALEVSMNTKSGVKDFTRDLALNDTYDFRVFVLSEDRDSLYNRINQRVDQMMADGLEDEVRRLLSLGYDKNLPALQGVGYKELISYFQGELGYEEAVEMIKQNTRRFAKRQFTWFKRLPHARWITLDHLNSREAELEKAFDMIMADLNMQY